MGIRLSRAREEGVTPRGATTNRHRRAQLIFRLASARSSAIANAAAPVPPPGSRGEHLRAQQASRFKKILRAFKKTAGGPTRGLDQKISFSAEPKNRQTATATIGTRTWLMGKFPMPKHVLAPTGNSRLLARPAACSRGQPLARATTDLQKRVRGSSATHATPPRQNRSPARRGAETQGPSRPPCRPELGHRE